MGVRCGGLSALLVLLVVSGCGGGRRSVLLPPRLDLQPYGRLGLVTFTVENAKGSLHEFATERDRKSTRLNSSHSQISYAVFCLKKKKKNNTLITSHEH